MMPTLQLSVILLSVCHAVLGRGVSGVGEMRYRSYMDMDKGKGNDTENDQYVVLKDFYRSMSHTGYGNLAQFGVMIYYKTRRNPLDYNNYGCWCGKGGSGPVLDDVDSCCRTHDMCYESLEGSGRACYSRSVYVVTYGWKWDKASKTITCTSKGACEKSLCECDRVAATCFSKSVYHKENKGVDKKKRCMKRSLKLTLEIE